MGDGPEDFPPLSPALGEGVELTDDQQDKINAANGAAAEALEDGKLDVALEKYTEAILIGSATAMLYAKRAQVLVKLDRYSAAINDCTAAIAVNENSAKAYKIRGKCYKKLEDWEKANLDLQKGLLIDFDEETEEIAKDVAEKAKELKVAAVKQRNQADEEAYQKKLKEDGDKYKAGLQAREAEWKEKEDAEKAAKDKAEQERKERVRKRENEEQAKEPEKPADEPGVPKSHGPPAGVEEVD